MKSLRLILIRILEENKRESTKVGIWNFVDELEENIKKTTYQLIDLENAFNLGKIKGALKKVSFLDYYLADGILMYTSNNNNIELEYFIWSLLKDACIEYKDQFYSYHDLYMAHQFGASSECYESKELLFINWIGSYEKRENK